MRNIQMRLCDDFHEQLHFFSFGIQVSSAGPCQQLVDNDSGNALVPSGSKP